VVTKIDHQINSAHKLYGTYFQLKGSGLDPFSGQTQIPVYGASASALNQHNAVLNEDWIASPSVLNQLRLSYTRRLALQTSLIRSDWPDFGSPITLGATPPRPPQFTITGRWNMQPILESYFLQQTYGLSDTLSWVHGSHSFRAGTWILSQRMRETGNWL